MSSEKREITVCGSFGYGNAGDEAIPMSYISLFKAAGVDIKLNILSRYSKTDMKPVIGTSDAQRILGIKNKPIVVSGGGIIEQKERATVLRCRDFLSREFSPNIGFIGVSVESGVDYGWKIKNKILKVLRQSTLPSIYTRDLLSEVTLRKHYPNLDVTTVGDLVLWLEAAKNKPRNVPHEEIKYIAVSLSSCWSNEPEWYQWIVNELLELMNELGVCLVFIPMSSKYDDDRVEHNKVANLIKKSSKCTFDVICLDDDYSAAVIAAVYRDAVLVISMRLHGCVIAYGQKTPFIGISYHPKLVGFSYTVGLRKCVLPTQAPNKQTSGSYGYRFKDLELRVGLMNNAAIAAISEQDFTALEYYKRKSLSAFKLFLTTSELTGM